MRARPSYSRNAVLHFQNDGFAWLLNHMREISFTQTHWKARDFQNVKKIEKKKAKIDAKKSLSL